MLRAAVQIAAMPDALGHQFAALTDAAGERGYPFALKGSPADFRADDLVDRAAARTSPPGARRQPPDGIVEVTARLAADTWRAILLHVQVDAERPPPESKSGAADDSQRAPTDGLRVAAWIDEDGHWWHAEWATKGREAQ